MNDCDHYYVCTDEIGKEITEYYFERDPSAFPAVLNYFISGNLHIPRNNCTSTFEEEVAYWLLPFAIQPCCDSYYLDEWEGAEEMKNNNLLRDTLITKDEEPKIEKKWKVWQAKVWNLFEHPGTSVSAKVHFKPISD